MGTPINVIIDNKTVVDDLESIEISQQEGTYCNAVTLSLKNKNFWGLCDPTINFGVLRIKVVIGSDTYQFLIEERDSTPTIPGVSFTVWGRSKQALLSKPYSKTINDTDDTSHPWQTADTTAAVIVAYVISSAYCSYGVTVSWNVSNFVVYKDSFSVSNQSPIDVISTLAQVVGAELKVNVDGSLSVETYSVAEGASVETYNDLDDIVALDESIDYPSGYNAVTVYGYDETGGGGGESSYLALERTDEVENIYPGTWLTYRIYYWHPKGHSPEISTPNGVNTEDGGSAGSPSQSYQYITRGTESITESVTLIFGHGNTSKPSTAGVTEVTGSEQVPIAVTEVTYNTYYMDYRVKGGVSQHPYWTGDFVFLFYFTDKSASANGSYSTVVKVSEDTEEIGLIENNEESTGTLVKGGFCHLKVFLGNCTLESIQCSCGGYVGWYGWDFERMGTPGLDDRETVTFTDGVGSLAYPYTSQGYSPDLTVRFTLGSRRVTTPVNEDEDGVVDANQRILVARVEYLSRYEKYDFKVPVGPGPDSVSAWFITTNGGMASVSVAVADSGSANVVLNISNWSSSTNVADVDVEVDGEWVGKTNASGNLGLSGLAKGDHTVKLTKDGYLQSDLDDIENSTFTVE